MKRPQIRRPSTGTVLGALALFIALGGTALAATATIVHISDPNNAANVARVDVNGQLKTVGTEGAPPKPLSLYKEIYDVGSVMNNVIIPATSATVAINRIDISPWSGSSLRRFVYLQEFAVPTGGSCDSPTTFRIVGVYEIGPGTNAIDNPDTPLIVKPLPAKPAYCLIAQVYPNGSSDGTFSYFVASGFVVSGTLPAGTAATAPPAAANRPDGAQAQPTAPAGISG